jgi:multidrug resistance efflux pump
MQRRHEEQTETLIAIQQEITQIKPGADVTEMQRTIVTQRKDIKRLKDNNQALATDLEQARSSAKEARGELEREQRLRLEAEKKLSEYLDAQRKMAAQFS